MARESNNKTKEGVEDRRIMNKRKGRGEREKSERSKFDISNFGH